MAIGLWPWRVLRPVLLAGATTLTWLTLSGAAASADSTDSGPVLGGVTSSVSSLAAPLAGTLQPTPELAPPAPPASTPSGLLQPVAGSTDQFVAALPIVSEVVPAGTVSAVAVPVATVADAATSGLAETVVTPLVEAVPVLDPVVQPVSDLVTGAVPLPIALPSVPDTGSFLPDSAGLLAEESSAAAEAAADVPWAAPVEQLPATAGAGAEGSPAQPVSLAGTSASPAAPTAAPHSAGTESPLAGDPSPYPAPAGPSSGAGSGASPSGPTGSAPWLNDFQIELLLPGTSAIAEASQQSPSPVSFDPGSSPD